MKSSKLYLLISFMLLTTIAWSQKVDLKKADTYYNRGDFYKALEIYQQASKTGVKLDLETKKKVARCNYNLNNIDKAYELFSDIEGDLTGHDLFIYASTIHKFGFYEGAIEWYEKSLKEGENPVVVNELINGCKWAMENGEILSSLRVNPSTLLTFGQSFGIQYYKNGVVYSSALESKTGKNVDKQGMSFLNLFYSDVDNGDVKEGKKLFSDNLVFPFHVGAISFTSDYNTMYFTRSVLVKGRDVLKIFVVKNDGKEWGKPEELSINSNDYDCAMPAVSPDDKYLYFVSNMKNGGFGGKDIYVAEIKGNNRFGEVRNLGSDVNTFGDEVFPVVSKDNVLYFSSDGHYGFGGLDIFKAEFINGKWTNVMNLLQPYNSNSDDFGYVIDPTNKLRGFLSSNRLSAGDKKPDVIFYVRPVSEVKKEEPKEEARQIAGLDMLKKEGVSDSSKTETIVPEIVKANPYEKFSTILTSSLNGSPITGVKVTIKDPTTGEIIGEAVSSDKGEISITIPEKYRKDDSEFDIDISKGTEYKPKKLLINIQEFEEFKKSGISLTPIFNDVVLDDISGMVIPYVGNEITAEGYKILDRLATYLLSNPAIVVKLNGHTDARGNRYINLTISQQVAEKAEMYLKTKGVPDENMIPRGYAERYLVNKCKRGKICSEQEHLANRRVEVVIWRRLNQ